MPYSVLYIILTAAVVAILYSCFFIVNGKTAAILETFGRPHHFGRKPGLNFKMPFPITSVVGIVNLQLQEIYSEVSVKTKDNAFMLLPVTVQYRASDEAIGSVKAFYELESPEKQISSYVLNNVRQTASTMEMDDLYINRNAIEASVESVLQERFKQFGYIIVSVLIDEPQPSEDVRDAFNRVIASKREKEAAKNIAEAKRIELVGVAQAEKESKKLQGEGVASMRRAIAEGLKESMQEIKASGLDINQALSLIMDTNRLDTIDTAATHGNVLITDINSGAKELSTTVAAIKAVGKP